VAVQGWGPKFALGVEMRSILENIAIEAKSKRNVQAMCQLRTTATHLIGTAHQEEKYRQGKNRSISL
jgi:hypothetical protein